MTGISTPGRVRAVGAAVVAAVFVSGVLAGAAFERRRNGSRPTSSYTTVVPAEQVIENMKMAGTGVPVVYESLGLTVDQRARIRAIIDASRPKTDSLLRETWPQLRTLLDSVRTRIEQVLTEEQRARLAAMRSGSAAFK